MTKALRSDRFRLGACYYPEHWPEELWADDFRRMREMGFAVIRIAEFAWSIFEPEEGRFEFDFFDRVMDLAHEHGLQVIFGTPTATPPAWLTSKYPEALNVSEKGVQYVHGQRRHSNYNSPIYRKLCERIADKLAEHYAAHPALLGWQIDNEMNCDISVFYAEADQTAFRAWAQSRYGTLDALNQAWGAVFWNQTYSDWSQVRLPGPTPSDSPNPHHVLDQKRFISDSLISFAQIQTDAIRRHDQTHFITTNGLFGNVDTHQLTEQTLDFLSYDSYPNFSTSYRDPGDHPLADRTYGSYLSAVRDISPQFCVMEQQSGPGGWVNMMEQPSPKPGQMRLWTYQSIAHGADMLLYFRWRTATFGTEIYWHGINDYHNQPNRRCAEAAQIGAEVARLDGLMGAEFLADVAIVSDYDNSWDGAFDRWHGPLSQQSRFAWFKALQFRHVPMDSVTMRPGVDLSKYQVVVYPHPAILTEETANVLKAYVEAGGKLILGCRTGYKDANGHCPMRPMPGLVADLCGVTVEEFTRIGTYQTAPGLSWGVPSGTFNDVLAPTTAEVLATYTESHYAGKPAVTRNVWGSGEAYYFGGTFTHESVDAFADLLGLQSPLTDALDLPEDVELAIRGDYVFLLNYSSAQQTVTLFKEAQDVLGGELLVGEQVIPEYGVLVLRFAPTP